MNAKTLITAAFALIAAVAGTAAMAGEASYDYPTTPASSTTRAQVLKEAAQARAAGLIASGERSVIAPPTGMAKTRAQVVAETLEAIRVGAIDRGEHSVQPTAAQLQSIEMAGLRVLHMQVAAR